VTQRNASLDLAPSAHGHGSSLHPAGDFDQPALLRAVLKYAELGWRVVPVHDVRAGRCSCGAGRCASTAKHPRLKSWKDQATTDRATIRAWWNRWPQANIGILAEPRSRLVVLDVDPRNGGDESLSELEREYGPLPATLVCDTGGGGRHYYFRLPRSGRLGRSLGRGIDVQWGGALVIAPPSLHVSGGRYDWKRDLASAALADLPHWVELLAASSERNETRRRQPRGAPARVIREGERNVELTSIAGRMRLVLEHREAIAPALQAYQP
jgi:hypothetical protein